MALQSLTDEQKSAVFQSSRFIPLVEWAAQNKARYWSQLNGTSVPGNDHIKWAKSRFYAVNTVFKSLYNLENMGRQFLVLTTAPVYDDSQPFDVNDVIDYMVDNLIFESVMDQLYDERIKEIYF